MKTILEILCTMIVAFMCLFVWALAKVAGMASREEEEQWNNEQTHKKDK